MTGNIGIHHVHHLYSRIPFYRLPEVLADQPALAQAQKLTVMQSLACVKLKLWDEKTKRLLSFHQMAHLYGRS
jgi:omega-6 fatty acid desaturase (delta-12 desaturase)